MGFFEYVLWLLVLLGLIRNDYLEDERWWENAQWWKLWD